MSPSASPRLTPVRAGLVVVVSSFAVFAACGGCDHQNRPRDASPIVEAHSEPGQKALAESEQLWKQRQREEALARRRHPRVPTES